MPGLLTRNIVALHILPTVALDIGKQNLHKSTRTELFQVLVLGLSRSGTESRARLQTPFDTHVTTTSFPVPALQKLLPLTPFYGGKRWKSSNSALIGRGQVQEQRQGMGWNS